MFFKKKEPYQTVMCKARKMGGSANALLVNGLDLPAIIKTADESQFCSRIAFGNIYQKPGTMLDDHNAEEQAHFARFDRVTNSLGLSLHQGLMRQTLVFSTRQPNELVAELGLSLEQPSAPNEPTVG